MQQPRDGEAQDDGDGDKNIFVLCHSAKTENVRALAIKVILKVGRCM